MPRIEEGVYLEVQDGTLGSGSTSRKIEIKNYYLCRSLDEDTIEVRLLDMDDQPLGLTEKVSYEVFLRRFSFQPDYLQQKKDPRAVKVDKALAQAEAHVRKKEYFSAEYEYHKALKLDEENVRANFGVGKVYLELGETEKAREVFGKLAEIEAVFEEENKHIFNELGIELRRQGLLEEAIAYYRKALSFARDDEHLYFNVARAYFEKGDFASARQNLERALSLNPSLEEARALLKALPRAAS